MRKMEDMIHWQERGSRECLGWGRGLRVCPVEDGHWSLLTSLLHLYHQTLCVQLYLMDGHILGALRGEHGQGYTSISQTKVSM